MPMLECQKILKSEGLNKSSFKITSSGLVFLFTIAQTPLQIESIIQILTHYYFDKEKINAEDINVLFGSPSYNLTFEIIKNIIQKNEKELCKLFFKIWSTGISYEDFLYELNTSIKQIGILKPKTSQYLYYIIMKGWIQFAQGKTHSFDMLRLML
jgi:DNA polymerase III gamma/tau subunit